MALQVDRHRETRDVARSGLDEYIQRGGHSSESHRTDMETVHPLQYLRFHIRIAGIDVSRSQGAEEGALGELRGILEISSNAYADDHRRAGFPSALPDGIHNKFHNSIPSLPWGEHDEAAHILAPAPFGTEHNPQAVPGRNPTMNHRRGVIPGIPPTKRVADYRHPESAFMVSPACSLLHGGLDSRTLHPDIFTDIHEKHRHPRILTKWNHLAGSNTGVLNNLIKNSPGGTGCLAFARMYQCVQYIARKPAIGFQNKRCNIVNQGIERYGFHKGIHLCGNVFIQAGADRNAPASRTKCDRDPMEHNEV